MSRCAGQSGLKPVPLASTFTQSTPSFTCWRTALRASQGPVTISVSAAAYCSRLKMWVGCMSPRPPQTEMICFEAFTRGPGSRPSAIASRMITAMLPRVPTSLIAVKPMRCSSAAFSAASIAAASSGFDSSRL